MRIRRGEQGSALMIALVILIIVGGIGGAFLLETVARGRQSFYSIQMDEAQIICDAAIERARRDLWYYRYNNTWAWNDILNYCNNSACIPTSDMDTLWTTWDTQKDSSENAALKTSLANYTFTGSGGTVMAPPVPANSTAPSSGDTVHLGWLRPFGESGACYHVIVKDNNDGDGNLFADTDTKLTLVVTATLPDGTQKQVEVVVQFEIKEFTPQAGLLSDGTIEMGGGQVTGSRGKVHSNEAIYVNSQTSATQGFSAVTQVYNTDGTAYSGTQTANDSDSGAAPVVIEIPDPSQVNWLSKTMFPQSGATQALKLKSGGTVELVSLSTGLSLGVPDAPLFDQFTWSDAQGRWSMNNTAPSTANNNQIVYVETDFIAGTNDNWNLSVISQGSITWSGGGNYNPATISTTGTQAANNIGLVAMQDLKISGNGSSQKNGFFLAGEQVQLSGTVSITGSVISKDKADSSGSVVAPQGTIIEGVDVGGSGVTINFDSITTMIPVNPDTVKVEKVRRVNARVKK